MVSPSSLRWGQPEVDMTSMFPETCDTMKVSVNLREEKLFRTIKTTKLRKLTLRGTYNTDLRLGGRDPTGNLSSPCVLNAFPQLTCLEIRAPHHDVEETFMSATGKVGHPYLSKLVLAFYPESATSMQVTNLCNMFKTISVARFLRFREIHLSNYYWPITTEREIKKHLPAINFSSRMREFGITVYDANESAWRDRVRARRNG
ncbi:hypothetical protein BD410DRAFT_47464 [Rickenella mellea]|uniref:F-box domain-containing protein n=1 Tax=Rickenella mellea TaxID=50990 RepID=A0A4V6PN31_9AGAM|nr:hypothetical protein BD410DRAFT_47464 [Rickenella mellea]